MRPEPVVKQTVCTVCGLDWAHHKPDNGQVPLTECVRLLKAELATRPNLAWGTQSGSRVYTMPTMPKPAAAG